MSPVRVEPDYVLSVDGERRLVRGAESGESLLDVLRDRLSLTATKDGCRQGRCGSCSILLDGALVTACTVLAADAVDLQVTTAAGLGSSADPAVVQQRFVERGAVQCGFCTPGMTVAVTALLLQTPTPSEVEIREGLCGNLCRCTGYGRILDAVRSLATPVQTQP